MRLPNWMARFGRVRQLSSPSCDATCAERGQHNTTQEAPVWKAHGNSSSRARTKPRAVRREEPTVASKLPQEAPWRTFAVLPRMPGGCVGVFFVSSSTAGDEDPRRNLLGNQLRELSARSFKAQPEVAAFPRRS